MGTVARIFLSLSFFMSLAAVTGCGGGGGGDARSTCAELGANSAKVVGGEQCSGGESPVVGLALFNARDELLGVCSGTLVSLTSVLTAGHCLDGAANILVFTQTGRAILASEAQAHPNWLAVPRPGNPFDVAMLRVPASSDIGPVPLLLSRDIEVGDRIGIFGYGLDENDKGVFDRLQAGEAPLKAGEMRIEGIGSGLFGARFDDTNAAICQGDSGGPVTQKVNEVSALVGVASFTAGGCASGSISGFIDIQRQEIVDFILRFAPDAAVR